MSEIENTSKKNTEDNNQENDILFLSYLQDFIDKRKKEMPEGSYTTSLFEKGTRTIAQKVGEEAVETIIGAMANDDENFIYEAGDLIYHLIVLLSHKGYRIEDIVRELKRRHS
ncbi:MAG: phosphoribosyl-ATP diphosphatase [Bacteroidetes bacterium]|nr:phosphoribosyl-ATP diphosphatase [Bacteroidota bacterium]